MRRALLVVLLLALVGAAPAPAATRPSAAATAATRTVDADGVRFAYRTFGHGRPILFIQGLSGTMDGWDPRFLDAVAAQGRRVVVFDNEGMGRSRMRPGTLTIRRMSRDAAALLRALDIRRADVFGWSMGGMIAQSFAVRHPRLVRRLVLAATAPGDGGFTVPSQRALDSISGAAPAPLDALELLFPDAATSARDAFARNLALREGFVPRGPREVINAQAAASGRWLMGLDPAGARVARLRLPVLVGGGELDELLPIGNQRHVASLIPRAKLVTYDDASHGFFLQHRRDFLRRVDAFLG